MLQYEIKVLGNEMVGDNILYKLRIIDLLTLEKREIRVRYSLLYDLHNSLQDNNMNSQLPQFPKKEYLKGLFGENKVIKQREQMLGEYFVQLLRTPPPRHKELSEFLKDGVDHIRQQELQREVTQKSDFMKSLKFEGILKKSQFGKTSLVSQNSRKFILHKFYVVAQQSEQLFGQYFKTHVSICDFAHITQVHSIFFIRPKANLLDSMLGQMKPPKMSKKQQVFQAIYPSLNKKLDAVKIFSIEEYEGQCLEDVIKERKNKNIPFTFDELLNLAQRLLAAISFLHKRNIMTNRIFATSVIINQDNVKLTGINEPNEKYKEKYLLEGLTQDYDMVYIPPEKLNNFNSSYNPIKVDAWQFGVCLLKAALLLTNRELDGIQQLYIQKYLNQVQVLYGDVITEMIEQSLKYQYSQRADIRDLCFLANQTAIVPFTTQYLNQNLNNQVQVIRINKLNPSELQAITELIQKSSQILKIKLSFQQEIDQKELDKLLQLLGDFAVVQEITVILNIKIPINMTSFFSVLSSLKQLKRLALDIKGINFNEDELIYALAVLKDMNTLEHIIIDSSSLELLRRLRNQMGQKKLNLYHESNNQFE